MEEAGEKLKRTLGSNLRVGGNNFKEKSSRICLFASVTLEHPI